MNKKRIVSLILLLMMLAGGGLFVFQKNIYRGYPYFYTEYDPEICELEPRLTLKDVLSIAHDSGFKTPEGGYWKVKYSLGKNWRGNPFPDSCVWSVRLAFKAPPGNDYLELNMDLLLISDQTEETSINGQGTSEAF